MIVYTDRAFFVEIIDDSITAVARDLRRGEYLDDTPNNKLNRRIELTRLSE